MRRSTGANSVHVRDSGGSRGDLLEMGGLVGVAAGTGRQRGRRGSVGRDSVGRGLGSGRGGSDGSGRVVISGAGRGSGSERMSGGDRRAFLLAVAGHVRGRRAARALGCPMRRAARGRRRAASARVKILQRRRRKSGRGRKSGRRRKSGSAVAPKSLAAAQKGLAARRKPSDIRGEIDEFQEAHSL